MDIMMPEMDGYQTTRAIRELPQFRELPIIALTAKAMKDDRRKCLDAGASDYIAKPVQGEQLRSLLRVWLDRPRVSRNRARHARRGDTARADRAEGQHPHGRRHAEQPLRPGGDAGRAGPEPRPGRLRRRGAAPAARATTSP